MTQRLNIHYPAALSDNTLEELNQQRIYDLIQVQNLSQEIFDEIADKPHLDSFLLENVELSSSGVNLVSHNLDRVIRGFKIVRINANANVWEDETDTSNRARFLPLQASANCTVSLEVF